MPRWREGDAVVEPGNRFALVLALLVVAVAATGPAAAGDARPAVVELYTSQGCSDCPPADAQLGELARRSDVLALAFHVDYWDQYGWRDRFELPAARERQFAYVRHFGNDWVYTPQMVVDGTADVVGGDVAGIDRLLAAPRSGVPVRIAVRDGVLQVEVDAGPGRSAGEVTLLSFMREAVTAIGRGENTGRTLREFNIVRSCAPLGDWHGAAASFRVPLSQLPRDAEGVAVLVQQKGPGPIIGAAQADLPRTLR
jgi:hypothetical protein